jgi:hypothetical protein
MQKLSLCILFFIIFNNGTCQLPSDKSIGDKLDIKFNKNIEFLGFIYFIAYEGKNSEVKTLEIDGKEILEKDWQNYGYNFYQKYKQFAESQNVVTAMSVAEHLWLSDFWPLLLQTQNFPQAKLNSTIDEKYYLQFSKNKDKEEAKKNVEIFLSACNELYKEVNFDEYLIESSVYYQSSINQIQENLPSPEFISFTEKFYRKKFSRYILIPSLTIPKGMGFGPRLTINEETKVYDIFGAVDFQNFLNTSQLNMGFGNQDKLRELSIHEFGHSFVNPEIQLISDDRVKITASLFEPISSVMENQGYNNWSACLTEHFVRAGEILIAEKMGNSSSVEKLKNEYLNTRKFIYIPVIIEELKRFDNDQTDNYQNVLNRVLLKLEKEVSQNSKAKLETEFSNNPRAAKFHTEDITAFWKIFDQNYPKLPGDVLQQEYLDKGSVGLKGFIQNRIESGKNLSKVVKGEIKYYEYIRPFTVSIDEKKERFYECFENLKKIYLPAVFPDVYFVIGANNSGGTIFDNGLIVGAEKFGKQTVDYKPALDIEYVDEVVAHELIHFQQKYAKDNSLLAQSVKEGASDFICELIAGSHSNKETYIYGDSHKKELWNEFKLRMYHNDWTNWLYYNKDKSRAKDLGYWAGYQICKAYYNRMTNKQKAISDILNIDNFKLFFEASGYNGE